MGLYVGIDPSLNRPGLGVVSQDGTVKLATSFSVGRSVRGASRLHQNAEWLGETLQRIDGKIARICVEGPSLRSVHREFDLGEGSGVLKLAAYRVSQIEPTVIEPLRLKKFATGKAQADKSDVIHAVKTTLALDLGDDDDAADACMLARMAWALDHPRDLTRRGECEVIAALLNGRAPKKKWRGTPVENI